MASAGCVAPTWRKPKPGWSKRRSNVGLNLSIVLDPSAGVKVCTRRLHSPNRGALAMAADSGALTLLHAAHLFDGRSTTARPHQAVLLRGDRIQAVGPWSQLQKQATPAAALVELGEACLTPGLIDPHTHLSLFGDGRSYVESFAETDEMMALAGAQNLRRHLAAGVTTLCDHGARNMVGFAIKESLRRGYITGPRVLVSGRPITCTEGHFHMCNEVADGEQEMRRSVRRLVHQGADFIKIMASGGGTVGSIPERAAYSTAELRAAVQEAEHFGCRTMAHCRAAEAMRRAVDAGVHMLEHAEFLEADGTMRFDPGLAEKLTEKGTWINPTLQAWAGPRLAALRAGAREARLNPAEQQELAAMEQRAGKRLDLVRHMLDCGLKEHILPGTDSGVGNLEFGHPDHDLQLLVLAGFTPADALLAATRWSAKAIELDDQLGTIEPGKVADLAAFAGDPTADIGALSNVVAVFQGGRRVV